MEKLQLNSNQIIKIYYELGSIHKVAKYFKTSITPIKRILKENGINLTNRRFNVNKEYFNEINSEEKAYWLGFLFADGYIRERKSNVSILENPFIKKIVQVLRYLNAEMDTPYGGDEMLFEILHYDFYNIPAIEIAKITVEVNKNKYGDTPTSIRKLIIDKTNKPTKDLFDKPINHQVSIRINYFLDYNLIKRKKKRI